jgi:hypothetical protein
MKSSARISSEHVGAERPRTRASGLRGLFEFAVFLMAES